MREVGGKILAGRFSRAERAKRRSKIDLDDASLSDKTRVRYYAALRKLLPWVEKCQDLPSMDDSLCKWIRKMWKVGEPLLTIGDGLSALHYFEPMTKRNIPHAWKLFAIWRRVEIPSRAPPLTWVIVKSLIAYELAHDNLEMAVILGLAFHCLLRTGEFLALTLADIQVGTASGICSLKCTKSGRRNAAAEMVSITDPCILLLVREFLSIKQYSPPHTRIWSTSAANFRTRFNALGVIFGLQTFAFRPYSLRRGGATHLFQVCNSMEVVLVRGRWETSRVARIYIADALSYLPSIKLNPFTLSMLKQYTF